MRVVALLMISLLLTGCWAKTTTVNAELKFAEIYISDDNKISWLRFSTNQDTFLHYAVTKDVIIISSTDGQVRPYIRGISNVKNFFVTDVVIDVNTQIEMYSWRDAIKQAEPRVLYPLFEFKNDEVAK